MDSNVNVKVKVKRWQDWVNLLLGAWLVISPWVMTYPADNPAAIWNACLVGLGILVFSIYAVYLPKIWEEGINIVLGLWMVISPWVLAYAMFLDLRANAVLVGIVVAALALWAMMRDKDFEKWRHDRHAQSQ
jgi:hypothetical protein